MKILVLSIALLSSSFIVTANQYYPNNSNGFTTPNFNWGNGTNGSNWNMPNMNWGNGNGYNSGSNWNMPNFNWGSNNRGSNWSMPSMNWGNNSRPWNFGKGGYNGANMPGYRFVPNPAYQMPRFKAPPALTPPKNITPKIAAPSMNMQPPKAPLPASPKAVKPVPQSVNAKAVVKTIKEKITTEQAKIEPALNNIPKPSDLKGVILAPENKSAISAGAVAPSK